MALSNTERQTRYRARIKAQLAQAQDSRLAGALATFKVRCHEQVVQAQAGPRGLDELVGAMVRGDRTVAGMQADLLAAVLGVVDPVAAPVRRRGDGGVKTLPNRRPQPPKRTAGKSIKSD